MKEYEKYKHEGNGCFFWYARDLMVMCGYKEWRNFHKLVLRAKTKCFNAEKHFSNYFRQAYTNNHGYRMIVDYKLSGYACYLITLEGDLRKKEICKAQKYFKEFYD